MAETTYEKILKNGNKVQVDSAIRDGNGIKIHTHYATKAEVNAKQDNLGFTPEDVNNKKTSIGADSSVHYPTITAVKNYVNSTVNSVAAYFRGSYDTKSDLMSIAWQTTDPTEDYYVTNNDYAYVEADESQANQSWRYIYVLGTGWQPQFKVNDTPFTQSQLDAINSGITSSDVSQITTNETDIASLQSTKADKTEIPTIPTTLPTTLLTTAPTSANTDGIKIVVLSEEPETKYNGYIYFIQES